MPTSESECVNSVGSVAVILLAEMNIQRLNVRIDQTEEDLLSEKMKIKKISDELNQTFEDMLNMSV